jgi:hypothetical protein
MFTQKKTTISEVTADNSKVTQSINKYFGDSKDEKDVGEVKRVEHQKLTQKFNKKKSGIGSDKLTKEAVLKQESSKEGNDELKKKIMKKKTNQKFIDYQEDETPIPEEKKQDSDSDSENSKLKITKNRKMREKLQNLQKFRKELFK